MTARPPLPAGRYAAFLRGLNVGGHAALKMTDLRAAFETLGLREVRTVQASGNVLFTVEAGAEGEAGGSRELAARLERGLVDALGYAPLVIVRSLPELQGLVASEPFHDVPITPSTRRYVSFLAEEIASAPRGAAPGGGPGEPGLAPGFIFFEARPLELLSAIELRPGWGTTEMMAVLEKAYGQGLTTRNWNTIVRLVASG